MKKKEIELFPNLNKTEYISRYGKLRKNRRNCFVKDGFMRGIVSTLLEFGISVNSSNYIGKVAYEMMVRPGGLVYHVPLHPLTMMESASIFGIDLSNCQKLAVWFHDVIYILGAAPGVSEKLSADLMVALVRPDAIFYSDLAKQIILRTAQWGDVRIPRLQEDQAEVMDLDLASLIWDKSLLLQVDLAVAEELVPIYGEKYYGGRKNFWKSFLDRGFVFRSKQFRKKEFQVENEILNLDEIAMRNVQLMVKALEKKNFKKLHREGGNSSPH